MIDKGWISIHRRLQYHWLWSKKPFSYGQSWIDILLECNHKENKFLIKDKLLTARRGESLHSLKTWSKRWGWTISKVRRFLLLLQNDSMIVLKSETVTTRVSVCNYNSYQELRNASETQVKRKRNASETQVKTNNNVNNEIKKEYSATIQEIVANFYSTKQLNYKLAIKPNNKVVLESCDTIDKLNRIDGVPFDVINTVLMRSIKDEFWSTKIISLVGLRKRSKNGLLKFENATASLLSNQYRSEAPQKELLGYRYKCPACENISVEREFKDPEEYDSYTCKIDGCTKTQLVNKQMIGSTLMFIKKVYKEES